MGSRHADDGFAGRQRRQRASISAAGLGGAWGDASWTENFSEFNAPGGANFSPSSVAGGVIWGGNLQMGNWVFGLEGGFLGMGLNETVASPVSPADTFTTKIDWMLMVSRALAIRGTARWCS